MSHKIFNGLALSVRDPHSLAQFYTSVFGMHAEVVDAGVNLRFESKLFYLALRQAQNPENYAHSGRDRYWKIGITLPNLDLAYQHLLNLGLHVSRPQQFEDIGYLAHLSDPEGFSIELLQHTFAGQERTAQPSSNAVMQGANLGQVTLRTEDIERELRYYQEELKMKLLSIQPLSSYGFDLYFLAHTDENPPNPDLRSVQNRPWLWQRRYTTLELQHIHGAAGFNNTPENQTGFTGLIFE